MFNKKYERYVQCADLMVTQPGLPSTAPATTLQNFERLQKIAKISTTGAGLLRCVAARSKQR